MNPVRANLRSDKKNTAFPSSEIAQKRLSLALVDSNFSGSNFQSPHNHTDDKIEHWTTGVQQIDACLPSGHMTRAGLHEIEPLLPTDMPSLTGFSFALLSRLYSSLPIIWCVTREQVGEYGHLYAHGLQRFGISPAQIIFSKVNKPIHLHFALEEAVKTDGVAAVLGEGIRPTFTGSRRLSLLARKYGRPCMFLNSKPSGEHGSAALTRWQIAPSQGVEDTLDPLGPGLPTWHVALVRARGGKPMPALNAAHLDKIKSYPWRIVWDDQTLSFRSVSVFRDGTVSTRGQSQGNDYSSMVG